MEHLDADDSVGAIVLTGSEKAFAAMARSQVPADDFRAMLGDGTNLMFFFGDHSTHAGNFVFHPNITGQLKRAWSWPITTFISIMNLAGDKVVRISDDGAAMITVDSGLAVYNYILPAQSK